MMHPGGAAAPSPTGDRLRHAVRTGRRAVELTREPVLPRDVMTTDAFHNALRVLAAVGHQRDRAPARDQPPCRSGCPLRDFDDVARETPLLLDLKPTGTGYMEDFHRAGGVPVLLRAMRPLLRLSHRGVSGRTLGGLVDDVPDPAPWQRTTSAGARLGDGVARVGGGGAVMRGAQPGLSEGA